MDLDVARLHTIAAAMAGRTSLSGVQRKISAGLSADRTTLSAVIQGGHYILKPYSNEFPSLPEIELVSMRLAELARVQIASCGLVRLKDGSLAYVARRFDRPEGGGKLRVEDFCQLDRLPPKEKYTGSAEACSRIIARYCDEPAVENLKLLRQVLAAWWIGNGDLHRKNLSLVVSAEGVVRLSPAYDMLSTGLLLPDDPLALTVGGKNRGLTRKTWLAFAGYAKVPERAAVRVFGDISRAMSKAEEMVGGSPLSGEMKETLLAMLSRNEKALWSVPS